MDLTFIIPAYNESARIERSLQQAIEYFQCQPYTWEILVVDDGSRDDTAAIVRRYEGEQLRLLEQPHNMGKGAAVRRGMLEATGNFRIFSDADFSTPIVETGAMMMLLSMYEVVIGSRALDRNLVKIHQPWYRETMGKIFNLMVQALAVPGIKDTQCGFKGFRDYAAIEIFSRTKIDGFSFDAEAIFLARRLDFAIKEMPVEWHNDERSTLHPIYDSLKMIRELLKIRGLHKHEKARIPEERVVRSFSYPPEDDPELP
ncbi:MAG: glycosyltransferase family 2 protein [Armatimonadetes bacterium]|nr:glycosyltransferase family 2 protein [Armatimonadota bacterium]